MSEELDFTASALGRQLTMFQIAANQGMPALVLKAQVRDIERLAGELAAALERVPASTVVHVNPELKSGVADLLGEYFHGRTNAPDTIPTEWNDD